MLNPDQTNLQLQKKEEHQFSNTIEEHKVDETKKEKRIKKKGFKKLHTISQELQHEYKKFFKISYTDETLNIRGFQKRVTDQKLEELLSTLSKRLEENKITLTHLSLNLRKSRLLTDAGIESIISHFATTFKNLESLDLDFQIYRRNQISEETMINLINNIGLHLQNLNHLSLNPYFYFYEESTLSTHITNNLLPNLKGLRTLNLNPSFNYSTKEKDTLEYVRAITSLPHLENLTLDLRYCQISEQGFTEIAELISNNLPHLKHLSLKLDRNVNISDKSFSKFFRVIGPSLKELETLEVSFRNRKHNITDQVLESLANKFTDNFQSLKSLVLNFEGCNKFTDEGVSKLVKSIGTNLKNLKHLDLNFNGLFHLGDETIAAFASLNNEHLPELESLKLAFAGAKITDQGFKTFLTAFEGKSGNIKELSLDLSGCKQLSEKSIKSLGTLIPQTFKNIRSLKLILRNYKQILTPHMKAFLVKSFKNISRYELTAGTLY